MANKSLFNIEPKQPNMEDLVEKLNAACKAYYNNDVEIMSNLEYDKMFDQLKDLEEKEGRVLPNSPTHKVGADPIDGLEKFVHTYPAKSLDKTKDIGEFVSKFRKGISDSNSSNDNVVLMYKEDGATVQAYYVRGKLDKLVTRGNGEVGSIVTHNAGILSGLPTELPTPIDLVVRGEAVMSYQEFKRINDPLPVDKKFATPRNLASATLTMLDVEEASKRHLMFQLFNVVHSYCWPGGLGIPGPFFTEASMSKQFNHVREFGFNVVPFVTVSVDDLEEAVEQLTQRVEDYEYPVDGLVAAMDNREYASILKGTEHHPHIMQGYAFKWADEEQQTTLREIEWSPSRTGLLNPVAVFDPVEIDGTTVRRASIHNVSILRLMNLKIGDNILVYKANMIIPQISENLDIKNHPEYTDDEIIELVGYCPTCGEKVAINQSPEGILTAFCPNANCPEKLIGNLAHFCERDCMDIQGMSEETITKLVEAGFIKEYSDFFNLYMKPEIQYLPGFGKQSWDKMCEAARKAKTTDFVHFVTALSIPNIGKGQAKTLLKYISANYDSLVPESKRDIYNPFGALIYMAESNFDFTRIDGFGDIMASTLKDWLIFHCKFNCDSPEMNVYRKLTFTDQKPSGDSTSSAISGKSFCITGKLIHHSNRQALVDVIEQNGGKWVDSVSSKTDYLINNDVMSTSGKNKKAKDLNIPIISEEDFLQMIR